MDFLRWRVDSLTLACILSVHRRDGEVGADPAPYLAARRDGGADAGLRLDPRGDNGDRGRVHGRAALADVRICADRACRRRGHRGDDRGLRRQHRHGAERHQKASSPIRLAANLATCSPPPASRPMPPAIFHLFTHAFFKGLLFLCCGSVIHAMGGEQDMRRMGGLWRKTPWTYVTMWVGALSLERHSALFRLLFEGHDPRCGLGVGDAGRPLRVGARHSGGVHDRLLHLARDVHDLSRRAARRRGDDAPCP